MVFAIVLALAFVSTLALLVPLLDCNIEAAIEDRRVSSLNG